jgi:nucleoside 2-deoxyribosyltransferase
VSTVYLAGPINGCSDAEATDWRTLATAQFVAAGWTVLDPMRRDYRGIEDQNVAAIIEGDLDDIRASDALLVMAERPTWGTAMELAEAYALCLHCVAVVSASRISPWLRHHAEIVSTLDEGIQLVLRGVA